MTIEEESKKPIFQRIREKETEKWKSFLNYVPAIKGIIVIILIGVLACSPILVFSSINFLSSIPIFYKIFAFVVFSIITYTCFFKLTFKYISGLSKTLKTYYGWEDGIAVLLLIYGIYSFLMQPTMSFLVEFRAELIGAGIATLLIGNASQAAQIQEEKKRLILQMGSPDNSFAIEAVRLLRQQEWLEEGFLKGAVLNNANLSNANLDEANLSGADLWEVDLSGAKLEWANLSEAWLTKAILGGVKLFGATLSGANLQSANLSGADLRLADLSEASLLEVDLSGAKLNKANLSGADLERAIVNETTNLVGAFYTEGENGTIFPDGFNPSDHGMHLIHDGESYEEAYKRVFPDK